MASKKELQFGAPIPQVFFDGKPDMELVKNTAQRAEELGFHSLWVQDQVAGYVPLLESVGLMTYASAITTRVKLGVSVIVFPVRNPVQLAKNIATLDLMSNGRAILGLGLGPVYQSAYFEPFGMTAGQALRRFNEGLAIMKSLWTQHSTDLDGEFYTLHETGLEPKPIQKPHPPIWIGGRHPNALRRAVRHGDGYLGSGPTSTENFGKHVELVRQYLDEEGRDPATFPISKRVYLAVDNDERRAKARMDEFMGQRYPWIIENRPDFVAEIAALGSPARLVEELAQVVDKGAELIVLNPLWDFVEQLEVLSEEVIPQLRQLRG